MIYAGNVQRQIYEQGGKLFHIGLLLKGGFNIPTTFSENKIDIIPEGIYVVRSSGPGEDSIDSTAAGRYTSLGGIEKKNILQAINKVKADYDGGDVVIQVDLSDSMHYSGVGYTNLNGETVLLLGKGNHVQRIVENIKPETEIVKSNGKLIRIGDVIPINVLLMLLDESDKIENYFGIPMDFETSIIKNKIVNLQARPLPNPTLDTLKEHEKRRLKKAIPKLENLDELVLGVGNYREILGNDDATYLSTSIFNYAFSGNGKDILGAVQLGRNELGYDIGNEIFPWVVMFGGKVYYNFAGDALQFRPEGISQEQLMDVINNHYLSAIRADPDLLNYPELRMYIQFPEQAKEIGLDPVPFKTLSDRNRKSIDELVMPKEIPRKRYANKFNTLGECLAEINLIVDVIRTKTAKEYVKAARMAFFSLEDIRNTLVQLQKNDPASYLKLASIFSKEDPKELRDSIVYDESINSFDLPREETFRYLGSFEISLPRGYSPARSFKKGKEIPNSHMSAMVQRTRQVLEYREKVKFNLFRDYDYLKQLIDQMSEITGLGKDVYFLDYAELQLLEKEPILGLYRIDFRKKIEGLFSDPVFGSDLETGIQRTFEKKPKLIFGALPEEASIYSERDMYFVDSVDQTIEIPENTKIVFVPDNVHPGSHLFTVLSDFGMPVIGIPSENFSNYTNTKLRVEYAKGKLNISTGGKK